MLWPVLLITVTERYDARTPAAAVLAASQRTRAMQELVVRVGLPVRRLSSTRDHDAWPLARHIGSRLDSRGQVHHHRDRAQHALRVMHEAHELAQVGPTAKVDHVVERWMAMPRLAYLHEQDASAKMQVGETGHCHP